MEVSIYVVKLNRMTRRPDYCTGRLFKRWIFTQILVCGDLGFKNLPLGVLGSNPGDYASLIKGDGDDGDDVYHCGSYVLKA